MTTLPAHSDDLPPEKHSETKAAMSPRSNAPVVTYPTLIAVVATVAALYFGKDIFLPLAVAVLLTFALAPVVSWLRRFRLPRVAAVLAVVIGAFTAIALFGAVVATQLGVLAGNLPLLSEQHRGQGSRHQGRQFRRGRSSTASRGCWSGWGARFSVTTRAPPMLPERNRGNSPSIRCRWKWSSRSRSRSRCCRPSSVR